jgi:hypothetical protein
VSIDAAEELRPDLLSEWLFLKSSGRASYAVLASNDIGN